MSRIYYLSRHSWYAKAFYRKCKKKTAQLPPSYPYHPTIYPSLLEDNPEIIAIVDQAIQGSRNNNAKTNGSTNNCLKEFIENINLRNRHEIIL